MRVKASDLLSDQALSERCGLHRHHRHHDTTVTMTPEPSRHLAPVPHLAHGVDLSVKGREEEDETPLSEEDSCHGVITVN